MNSPDMIADLTDRIQLAAQAASRLPEPIAVPELPPPPALPANEPFPKPDPLPLAEVSTMVPRAREKLKAGARAPGILRPMLRNQGGFNGIITETCNRLVEVSQQLRQENDLLRTHLDALTDYLARQHGWLETLAQDTRAGQRTLLGVQHSVMAGADAEQTAAHFKRLENTLAEQAGAVSRLDAQTEHRDRWMQDLQAFADEQNARDVARAAHEAGHGGRDAQEQAARFTEALQTADARLDAMGGHLNQLQQQSHGLSERLDRGGERADELFARVEAGASHTREVHSHLDKFSEHLNGIQRQHDEQVARLDDFGGRLNAFQERSDEQTRRSDALGDLLMGLRGQHDARTAHLDAVGTHLNSLQEQSHRHSERLDRLGERADELQARTTANDAYTREVHGHLDNIGAHLAQVDDQGKWSRQHLDALQAQSDGQGTHLDNLQTHADGINQRVDAIATAAPRHGDLENSFGRQGEHLNALQTHADRLGTHLGELQGHAERQNERMDALQRRLDASVELCERARADLAVATSHQRQIEDSNRRLEERQVNDASYLRAQLGFHQRLFSHWLTPALLLSAQNRGGVPTMDNPLALDGPAATANPDNALAHLPAETPGHDHGGDDLAARRKAAAAFSDHEMDALYLAFEDAMRGNRSDIKARLSYYLPYLESAHVGSAASPVLDLGCGRGEWLEVLRENGFAAAGVDLNACMIEQCRARRLNASLANALDYLAAQSDASFGAITAFHLIEHLPFPVLVQFFNECRRVLQPGGVAIFETPNPTNVLVGACFFWHDYTHQRPLPPLSTRFLVEHVGFAKVEVVPLHPWSEDGMVQGDGTNPGLVARFNEFFYGPQDYAIVARVLG